MYHILRLYSKPHRNPWLNCSHRWGTSQYWRHSAASLSSKLHLGLGIDGKLLQDVKLQHRTKINNSASLVPLDFSNHRLIGLLSSNILGKIWNRFEKSSRDVKMLLCCCPQSGLIRTVVTSLLDGSQEFYDSLTAGCCLSFSGHNV